MTPDEPSGGERSSPEDEAKRSDERHRTAERRLLDEMARHRHAEAAELRRFGFGCIGLIVLLFVALVVGFLVF